MSVFKVILTILVNIFILFLFFVFCFDFYAQIVLQDVTRQAARYSITRGRMGDLWFNPAVNSQTNLLIPSLFLELNALNELGEGESLTGDLALLFCGSQSCGNNVLEYYRNLYLNRISGNQDQNQNVLRVPILAWYSIGLANRLVVSQLGGAVSQYPCFFPGTLNDNALGLPVGPSIDGCLLCFARPSQPRCPENAFGGDSIVVTCMFNSGNAVTNFVRNLGGFFGANVSGLGILQAEFVAFYPSSLTNPCLWPGC
jgi:hypothetical protein